MEVSFIQYMGKELFKLLPINNDLLIIDFWLGGSFMAYARMR